MRVSTMGGILLEIWTDAHVFLSIAPMALSCSSTRMHRSSISLDCSGSYLDKSAVARAIWAALAAGEVMVKVEL